MTKVGIIGGTGYTGVELLRLLVNHPRVELISIISRQQAGNKVADLFPSLRGHVDLAFQSPQDNALAECDVVFSATPSGVAMQQAAALLDGGAVFIDLSADFRLKQASTWEHWYGQEHSAPELLVQAVYGLPEVNRDKLKHADLIACAGCYPTASQLALIPLLDTGLIDNDIVIDAKSGVSGAGRGESVDNLLSEASESIKAYAVNGHRHLPEILQGLQTYASEPLLLTFVPHLAPMIRGILVSCYTSLLDSSADLQQLYENYYANEPFVDVMPAGISPQTRSVRGSNYCRIGVFRPQNGDKAVILAVEDNLVKGAAGQAVQCMNIRMNWPEVTGLEQVALMP